MLDTNTVILLPWIEDPSLLPGEPLITAVTLAELSAGPRVAATDEDRTARQAHQQAEADFDPLPFDARAARAFGRVAASLRRSGRKHQARAYDAMIAATALANDLPAYRCNPRDFSGIDGIEVVSVPNPGHTTLKRAETPALNTGTRSRAERLSSRVGGLSGSQARPASPKTTSSVGSHGKRMRPN